MYYKDHRVEFQLKVHNVIL